MLNHPVSRRAGTGEGWLIVSVGFFGLAIAFSARSMLGLAMPEWETEFGWSRATISGIAAMTLVGMAMVAPFIGYAIDRHGPRMVFSAGLGLTAASCALIATMQSTAAFLLAQGALGALAYGAVATHAVSSAVARALKERQGLAIGIATSGSTAGQFVVLPILGLVLAGAGWRMGYSGLALAAALAAIVAAIMLPSSGRKWSSADHSALTAGEGFLARASRLGRVPAFQALFWSYFICGFTTTGAIETHLLPFAAMCGISPEIGATAFGLLCLVNTLGMIGAGYLTDRMNRILILLLAAIYIARAFTFLLLPLVLGSPELIWVFAILFGAVDYATVPVTASLAASRLGVERVGTAMGMISAGHALGAAAGAYFGGALFDLSGGYDWLWASAFGLALVAGAIVLLLRPASDSGRMRLAVA